MSILIWIVVLFAYTVILWLLLMAMNPNTIAPKNIARVPMSRKCRTECVYSVSRVAAVVLENSIAANNCPFKL